MLKDATAVQLRISELTQIIKAENDGAKCREFIKEYLHLVMVRMALKLQVNFGRPTNMAEAYKLADEHMKQVVLEDG